MPGSPAVLDTASAPRAGQALPTGVLAFLITDIEGPTQRWEAWPEAMRVAMARHDHLVREALLRAGGHVFRTAGDAFYAAFVSPSDAIAAALAAQQALGGEDFSDGGGIKVRMAIHAGPAESRDNDYFGQGMNRCARLLGIAYGGQVLISAAAADMTHGELPPQASLLDLGQHRLKDLAGAEQVYQLVAPGLTARFPTLRSLDAKVHNLPRPVTSFVPRGRRGGGQSEAREVPHRDAGRLRRLRQDAPRDRGRGSAPGGVSRRRLDRRACPARGSAARRRDGLQHDRGARAGQPLGDRQRGRVSAPEEGAPHPRQLRAPRGSRGAARRATRARVPLAPAPRDEPRASGHRRGEHLPGSEPELRTEGITAAEALGYGAIRL